MSSTPCSKNNVIAPAMPVLFRNSLSHRSQNSHMAIKKAQSVTNILQDDLSNNNNNTHPHTHTHTHTHTESRRSNCPPISLNKDSCVCGYPQRPTSYHFYNPQTLRTGGHTHNVYFQQKC